jgi:hypothetical protein
MNCISCEQEVSEEQQFCPGCGEKLHHDPDFSIWRFLREGLGRIVHLDGKTIVSVRELVLRPGQLTADFLIGKRKIYLKPFQLFLLANIVFFFLPLDTLDYPLWTHVKVIGPESYHIHAQGLIDQALEERGENYTEFSQYYYERIQVLSKSFLILLVPFWALFSYLFHYRKMPYYVQHLVFALHLWSFLLLYMSLGLYGLFALVEALGVLKSMASFAFPLFFAPVTIWYLFTAYGKVIEQKKWIRFLKAIILTAICMQSTMLYNIFLFHWIVMGWT